MNYISIVALLLLSFFSSQVQSESLDDAIKKLPKEEWVWQSLHLIDTVQTIKIAQNPNIYFERNPLLGNHPSTRSVIIWGVADSLTHAGFIYIMQERNLPEWAIKMVEYVSITSTGLAVGSNFSLGL
jgi:hypothetical protein